MGRPELLPGRVGGAASEFFSLRKFPLAGQVTSEVIAGIESFKVIGTAKFLGDPEDLAVLRFGGGVVTLIEKSVSQTAMTSHRQCILGYERFRLERDELAEHGFRLGVVLIAHRGIREAVALDQRIRV